MSFYTPYIASNSSHTRNFSTHSGSGMNTPLLEPKRRNNVICSCIQNVDMEIFRGIFTEQWLRGELFDANSPLFFCTACGPPVIRESCKQDSKNNHNSQNITWWKKSKKSGKKENGNSTSVNESKINNDTKQHNVHSCTNKTNEPYTSTNNSTNSKADALAGLHDETKIYNDSELSQCQVNSPTGVAHSSHTSHINASTTSTTTTNVNGLASCNDKCSTSESKASNDALSTEPSSPSKSTKNKGSSSWTKLLRLVGIGGKSKENNNSSCSSSSHNSKGGKAIRHGSISPMENLHGVRSDDEDEELPITPRTQKELFLCATCGTCYCRDHANDHYYSRGNHNDTAAAASSSEIFASHFSTLERPSRCSELCARYPNHSVFIGVPTFVSMHPSHAMTASEWGLLFPTVLIKEIEESAIDMHEAIPFYKNLKLYLDNLVFETNKHLPISALNSANSIAINAWENNTEIHHHRHHHYPKNYSEQNMPFNNPFNGSAANVCKERSKSVVYDSHSNSHMNSSTTSAKFDNITTTTNSNISKKNNKYFSHDNICGMKDELKHTTLITSSSSMAESMKAARPSNPSTNNNNNSNSNSNSNCNDNNNNKNNFFASGNGCELSLSLPVYYSNVPDDWSYMMWCAKCSSRPVCLSSRTCNGDLAAHRHLRRLGHLVSLLAYLRHRGVQLELPSMYLNYTSYRQEVRNRRHAETQRKHISSRDAQTVMKSTEMSNAQMASLRSSSPTQLSSSTAVSTCVSSGAIRVPLMSRTEVDKLLTKLGICGFTNRSYFCYMNSVLQCVLRCMFFTLPLLRLEPHKRPGQLTSSVCNLLLHLRTQTYQDVLNKAANPFVQAVYGQICKIFDIFGEDQQQDAHELLITLLNGIADEFDKYKIKEEEEKEREQQQQQQQQQRNMKRISFEGVMHSEVVCCGCHQVTSRDEMFMSVSVPVMKSLELGLETVFSPVHLSGKDQYACEKCFNKLSKEDQKAHNAKVTANRANEHKNNINNGSNNKSKVLEESSSSSASSPTKNKKGYFNIKNLTKAKIRRSTSTSTLTIKINKENSTVTELDNENATDVTAKDKETPLSANCIYQDAVVNSCIARLGGTLVVHLLRFQYNPETKDFNKVSTPVLIPLKIDLSHFVSDSVLESYGRERSLHALQRRFPTLEREELELYLQKNKWNYNAATRRLMDDGHYSINHSRQQSSAEASMATPQLGRHGLVFQNAVALNSDSIYSDVHESNHNGISSATTTTTTTTNNNNNTNSNNTYYSPSKITDNDEHFNALTSSFAENNVNDSFNDTIMQYNTSTGISQSHHSVQQTQSIPGHPYIFRAEETPMSPIPPTETNPIANNSMSGNSLMYNTTYSTNTEINNNIINNSININNSNTNSNNANTMLPFAHVRSSSSLYMNFVNRTAGNNLRVEDDLDPYNARYTHIPSLTRQLVGFITHRGSLDSGHYVAYIRYLSKPDMWFRCDDEDIDLVDERYIMEVSSDAYLAFYE